MDEEHGQMIAFIAVILVLLLVFSFAFDFWGFVYRSFIGKHKANLDREIFEESKSYNEGKEQDLLKYRLEYLQAKDPDSKEAIASTIRLMFADYDETKLTKELRDFLTTIKYGGLE